MTDKRPLVLFSGGLDSTYILLGHARKDQNVDITYCQGGQRDTKQQCEGAARENILSHLHRTHDNWYANRVDEAVSRVWTTNRSFTFAQFMPWFVSAFELADATRHSSVEIGYVMGDQIVQHLDKMVWAWEYLWSVCKHGDVVPLKFPLRDISKATIVRDMPAELYRMTWVCELPQGDVLSGYKPCGDTCEACITRSLEEHRFLLKNGETLTECHDRKIAQNLREAEVEELRERRAAEEAQAATQMLDEHSGDQKLEVRGQLLRRDPPPAELVSPRCHEIDGPSEEDLQALDDYGHGRLPADSETQTAQAH